MKKRYTFQDAFTYVLLMMLFISSYQTAKAQQQADTITFKQRWSGTEWRQHGQRLRLYDLSYLMRTVPEAHQEMTAARTKYTAYAILSGAGGFLIGFEAGGALYNDEPNWTVIGIGAGLIGASIPLYRAFVRRTNNAVRHFNQALGVPTTQTLRWEFGISPFGAGLVASF